MAAFGNSFQILALLLGAASAFFYYAAFQKGSRFAFYANIMRTAQFICVTGALCFLGYAILADDFSILYVCSFSERSLPTLYKMGAIWIGPEGAMLFCAWICLICAMFESWRVRKSYARYHSALNVILSVCTVALLVMPVFMANPFSHMQFFPSDGNGLAPSLQTPAAFLYPVVCIMSFVSALVLFSHSCAAMALKDYSDYWLRVSYRWIAAAMCFAVATVILNTYFSFGDVFLRSFWGWNLIEISSLMPAIACAGLLHTANLCIGKGRLKRLCFLYPFVILELVMLIVFFNRGGHVANHYFFERVIALEPILFVMAAALVMFMPLYARAFKAMAHTQPVIVRTKENILMMLNVIALSTIVFFLFGIAAELFLLSNRPGAFKLGEQYYKYLLLANAGACVALYVYYNYSVLRPGRLNYGAMTSPRFGRRIAHAGLFLIFLGAFYSGAFYHEKIVHTSVKGEFEFSGHNFLVNSVKSLYKDNYLYMLAEMSVHSKGTHVVDITPEIRRYSNTAEFNALTENFNSGFSIFSVAIVSYNLATREIALLVMDHPLASFVPIGVVLLFIGILYTAVTKRFF